MQEPALSLRSCHQEATQLESPRHRVWEERSTWPASLQEWGTGLCAGIPWRACSLVPGLWLLGTHLELVHDFPDGFAAGPDDAGMDAVVQWDVFRDHLLKLTHDLQDGVPGGFRVLLVPCDGDLVLGLKEERAVREGGILLGSRGSGCRARASMVP